MVTKERQKGSLLVVSDLGVEKDNYLRHSCFRPLTLSLGLKSWPTWRGARVTCPWEYILQLLIEQYQAQRVIMIDVYISQ